MKRKFVETLLFSQLANEFGIELLIVIQNQILKDPLAGRLVQNTGGIRKLRVAAKGKGKSGGLRLYYLDIPHLKLCYLLYIVAKSESENISDAEKKELRKLALFLKSEEKNEKK